MINLRSGPVVSNNGEPVVVDVQNEVLALLKKEFVVRVPAG